MILSAANARARGEPQAPTAPRFPRAAIIWEFDIALGKSVGNKLSRSLFVRLTTIGTRGVNPNLGKFSSVSKGLRRLRVIGLDRDASNTRNSG